MTRLPQHGWGALLGAVAALAAFEGCTPQPVVRPRSAGTQSDLLRARYADLETGRFAIIADFEDASHGELFRMAGPNAGSGGLAITARGGVEATGAGCLQATFRSPDATLVADNTAARTWLLKRDWRTYSLLFMNVHSPHSGLRLQVIVVGGRGEYLEEAHTETPLNAGWNHLRFDLDELGDYIALDDVREIRWSLSPVDGEVTLRFDDIVLTDNRETVFEAGDDAEGGLYVERVGRRLVVGARGRFELAFANGQIVRWYALHGDPARLNDLVGRGNTLGPTLVYAPVGEDWISDHAFRWPGGSDIRGDMLVASQRLLEASAVRVVIDAGWMLGGKTTPSPQQQRWRYVVYPGGEVYVSTESSMAAVPTDDLRPGLVVSMKPRPRMAADLGEAPVANDVVADAVQCACLFTPDEVGLLFVPPAADQPPELRLVRAPDRPRVSLVALGRPGDWPRARTHSMLSIYPPGNCGQQARDVLARSFARPPKLRFLVGEVDRATPGDVNGDGFDESQGAYMLRPDANRIQFRLGDSQVAPADSAFCVQGSEDREAWVYVDYAVHHAVARDRDGRLVFRVSGHQQGERLVEVYLRHRPAERSDGVGRLP